MLTIKRIYEAADINDGFRILVDRIWPRGISKEKAALDLWLKEVGPSTVLRKSFGHDPKKYSIFKLAYEKELMQNQAFPQLIDITKKELAIQNVTLLFGAKDELHNQAVILLEQLNKLGIK